MSTGGPGSWTQHLKDAKKIFYRLPYTPRPLGVDVWWWSRFDGITHSGMQSVHTCWVIESTQLSDTLKPAGLRYGDRASECSASEPEGKNACDRKGEVSTAGWKVCFLQAKAAMRCWKSWAVLLLFSMASDQSGLNSPVTQQPLLSNNRLCQQISLHWKLHSINRSFGDIPSVKNMSLKVLPVPCFLQKEKKTNGN